MNTILKYILFRIVLVVIVLHAIIPHPHSDEISKEKHVVIHQESNSLIGIIRLAFHENNDEYLDNLVVFPVKNIKTLDDKTSFSSVAILSTLFPEREVHNSKKETLTYHNDFHKNLFVKLNGMRGPPLSS